jgi:hypothetical protein
MFTDFMFSPTCELESAGARLAHWRVYQLYVQPLPLQDGYYPM